MKWWQISIVSGLWCSSLYVFVMILFVGQQSAWSWLLTAACFTAGWWTMDYVKLRRRKKEEEKEE